MRPKYRMRATRLQRDPLAPCAQFSSLMLPSRLSALRLQVIQFNFMFMLPKAQNPLGECEGQDSPLAPSSVPRGADQFQGYSCRRIRNVGARPKIALTLHL